MTCEIYKRSKKINVFNDETIPSWRHNYITSTLLHKYVVEIIFFKQIGFQPKNQIFSFHLIPFASKSID